MTRTAQSPVVQSVDPATATAHAHALALALADALQAGFAAQRSGCQRNRSATQTATR
jgi:hypothetical protein